MCNVASERPTLSNAMCCLLLVGISSLVPTPHIGRRRALLNSAAVLLPLPAFAADDVRRRTGGGAWDGSMNASAQTRELHTTSRSRRLMHGSRAQKREVA